MKGPISWWRIIKKVGETFVFMRGELIFDPDFDGIFLLLQ
jgi:hypothetical protein